MNYKFIYFTFFINLLSAYGQEGEEEKSTQPKIEEYEFKEVSKAELQQKYHPKDSLAAAAIIYEKGDVDFSYS